MEQISVMLLLALLFLSAAVIVTLEDRRGERRRKARVHAALARLGEARQPR